MIRALIICIAATLIGLGVAAYLAHYTISVGDWVATATVSVFALAYVVAVWAGFDRIRGGG